MSRVGLVFGAGAVAALLVGGVFVLDSAEAKSRQDPLPEIRRSEAPTPRVTKRLGNRQGAVLVLMYHKIGPKEAYMVRSKANFEKDLDRLYRLGYRPVTLEEYSQNRMPLPRGASPVVLTFDDSDPTQFRLKPDGSIDPNCFVGVWAKFAKKYPDFPVKGTFFILPNGPFGQSKLAAKKLEMLRGWGSEIGSHTMTHTALNTLTDAKVSWELGASYEYIAKLGFTARSFATPYGIAPKNRTLLKRATWNGRTYGYENIVLAGSSPAPSPLSRKLDRTRIPRVKAYGGELGINDWLTKMKQGKPKPYVQP